LDFCEDSRKHRTFFDFVITSSYRLSRVVVTALFAIRLYESRATMVSLFAAPIATDAPLALFPRRDNHPVSRAAVTGDAELPVETNK
jgi:hypothetical protein